MASSESSHKHYYRLINKIILQVLRPSYKFLKLLNKIMPSDDDANLHSPVPKRKYRRWKEDNSVPVSMITVDYY